MKKVIALLLVLLPILTMTAQTAVNKDATPKFRGNVAIMVDAKYFTFENGVYVKAVEDNVSSTLQTTLRALVIQKFQNMCFAVVNRDDEAYAQVKQLIEENKLEDYLDGFSVQAKNQGADYLYVVEAITYAEDNEALQFEVSTRLISIETNFGYHQVYRSGAIQLGNEEALQKEAVSIIKEVETAMEKQLYEIFPEQYYIAKANGKTLYLGAYQPNGLIRSTDKFYAFSVSKENIQLGQDVIPIQVLEKVAVATNPAGEEGYVKVKANKTISNTNNVVLFRNLSQPVFSGTNQMLVTFFGLDYELNSYEGLVKNRINNAICNAITDNVGTQLIEHDHLTEIKKEKELQKSEDFLDGHVVAQMKSIGAQYLLKLESFNMNGLQVSFKLSLISVESNQIARTVDVVSSIDNLENEITKVISERFGFYCVVKPIDKNTFEISSTLTLNDKTNIILQLTKAMQNPTNNEITYSRVDVCKLRLKEYKGNKAIMTVDKMLSENDMQDLYMWSTNGYVTYHIEPCKVKSDTDTQSDVQKAAEKKKKKSVWEKLKQAGSDLLKSSNSQIQINGKIKTAKRRIQIP